MYTIGEVLSTEAQLLHGHVELAHTSPLEYLSRCCHGSGLPDEVVSLGCELIVRSAREYRMLQLHARLLAACTLYLAVRNAPAARDGSGPGLHTLHRTEGLATRAGYPTCVIVDHVRSLFRFLEGEEVALAPRSAPPPARAYAARDHAHCEG